MWFSWALTLIVDLLLQMGCTLFQMFQHAAISWSLHFEKNVHQCHLISAQTRQKLDLNYIYWWLPFWVISLTFYSRWETALLIQTRLRPKCISTLTDTSLLTPARLLWECVRFWASSKSSDQLSRAELMHTAINTWPPIPSFIYSAMSEAWPFLSLCTSPFILQPVIQLGFIKGTQHRNKLYYQSAHREFIGPLTLPSFLLFSSLFCLFVHYRTCHPCTPTPPPSFASFVLSSSLSLYLPITDESISRASDAERVQ